jgi:predicted  nucleic acid-binding Zn-ribbon protein
MLKKLLILHALFFLFCSNTINAGDIREALVKIDEHLHSIDKRVENIDKRIDDTNKRIDDTNKRIDDVNRRLDDSRSYDQSIIIAILSMMAMILWDRKTALKPINQIIEKLKEKVDFM